ncbi:MATE family efflux transporter [Microvirga rosea]|uniref:MATE family efflux transporter n=1 Tax=Microvirga rosea TaxID=2715425 RepID=UPI001D0B79A2|nr:MATE family efflux transporter [Microvirga rosea]MCB8822735.1 MATE family efflux transporter [Microvirga rosea]
MEGSVSTRRIAVTHKRMLALALPMTLSHVTTPLLGLVDATVIGRLGEAHLLGAVALGAVVFDFVFWTFGSLRMATAGMTAQATGAGDRREIDRVLARALLVAGITGLCLILLQWPIALVAFPLTGASDAVQEALSTYFFIRIWSAPFTLANYVILGSTLGRARTDLGLLLQVAINVANILLTSVLVLVFHWGVAGAAIGTTAAEVLGVGLGIMVLRRLGSNPFAIARHEILNRAAMLQTLSMNRDILIRNMALMLVFAVFSALGARSGDVTLAANAVLYNMFLIGGYFLDGFATAAETLCGQCIGARDERSFSRAVTLSLGWSFGFGLAVTAIFLLGGSLFIDFVTTSPDVRLYARDYLVYAALTPLMGAAAFAFDGIYTGATWTKAMRDLMLVALAAYGAILFAAGSFGNAGLWTALLVFLATRGLGQALLCSRLTRKTFAKVG